MISPIKHLLCRRLRLLPFRRFARRGLRMILFTRKTVALDVDSFRAFATRQLGPDGRIDIAAAPPRSNMPAPVHFRCDGALPARAAATNIVYGAHAPVYCR